MYLTTDNHGKISCDIEVNEAEDHYTGTLKYNTSEIGIVSGPSADVVRAQFQAICEIVDAGGMVRNGIIMLGYHNEAFCGDVLLVNGEFIGEWTADELEWCYFTAADADEVTCSAPSPWMLHDSIAYWIKRDEETSGP